MFSFNHPACSRARYIQGWRRHTKGTYDRVMPFLFTALFGAVLGMLSCDPRGDAQGRGRVHPHAYWWLLALACVALLWWGVRYYLVHRQKKIGTLYIITALHPGAPVKELGAGAIGRSFHRVRSLPGLKLLLPANQDAEALDYSRDIRQLAPDLTYAMGDEGGLLLCTWPPGGWVRTSPPSAGTRIVPSTF